MNTRTGRLAVLHREAEWVLLDEATAQLGRFDSEGEALEAARSRVCEADAPHYVLIKDADGSWRETLLAPPAERRQALGAPRRG